MGSQRTVPYLRASRREGLLSTTAQVRLLRLFLRCGVARTIVFRCRTVCFKKKPLPSGGIGSNWVAFSGVDPRARGFMGTPVYQRNSEIHRLGFVCAGIPMRSIQLEDNGFQYEQA